MSSNWQPNKEGKMAYDDTKKNRKIFILIYLHNNFRSETKGCLIWTFYNMNHIIW